MTHFIHHISAILLFAMMFADVLILRSPAGEAIEPRELVEKLRKFVGIAEMILFILVFALGLSLWIPLIKAYPPHIFHTKALLAVVFIVLAKVRMLKERKAGVQFFLTRIMAAILFILVCLGAAGGLA